MLYVYLICQPVLIHQPLILLVNLTNLLNLWNINECMQEWTEVETHKSVTPLLFFTQRRAAQPLLHPSWTVPLALTEPF